MVYLLLDRTIPANSKTTAILIIILLFWNINRIQNILERINHIDISILEIFIIKRNVFEKEKLLLKMK
jgi:hypothetical protein